MVRIKSATDAPDFKSPARHANGSIFEICILWRNVEGGLKDKQLGDFILTMGLNGAKAMGLEKKIGTISIGKKADVVLWSKNDLPFIPGYNYLADLIFNDSCRAHTVFINGEKIIEDYTTLFIDEKELIQNCRQITTRYRQMFKNKVAKLL